MQQTMRVLAAAGILLLALGAAGSARAQVYPQFDLDVIVGIPQGEFQDNVDNVGFGLSAFVGIGLGQSPLVVGADLGILVYGFERRSEPFSSTIPDVRVDVETSNNIFLGHVVARLQPPSGPTRPYLEGLFGVKYFFTETSIKDDNRGSESIASSTNFDDAAPSYGVGGGIDVRLHQGSKQLRGLYLHAGVRYLLGTEAEYLKEGSIERVNGRVVFDTIQSKTNMIVAQLGVSFTF